MPDKKLTDNEITIKALKELLEVMLCEGDLQRTSTISHTIDFINRLQAEIERLESLSERLGDDVDLKLKYIYELEEKLKTTKAEAYKECLEKVKEIDLYQFIEEYYQNAELRYEVRRDWFDEHIDNLLKELVGEDDG